MKLFNVTVTKTVYAEVIVYAEDAETACQLAEDEGDLEFDDEDYSDSRAEEITKTDKWNADEIPLGETEDRTCQEILADLGTQELPKHVVDKSQIDFNFGEK